MEALSRKAEAGQVVPLPADVMPGLVTALHDPNPEVRFRAIDAINGIGTGAEEAISPLVDILKDLQQPVDLRRHAVMAIRSVYAGLALNPLNAALSDSDRVVRGSAAGALGSTREKARMAVPQLIRMAKEDPYSDVRASAVEVMGKIQPTNQDVWITLNTALQDRSWRVRRSAADALAEIGNQDLAKVAVSNLLLALDNQNYTLQTSAAKTLGLLGPSASHALPGLKNVLQHNDNFYARAQAAGAIGNIGSDDPEIFSLLVKAFQDPEPLVRNQSYEAFHKLLDARMGKYMSAGLVNDKDLSATITVVSDALKATDSKGFSDQQREALATSLQLLKQRQAQKAIVTTILLKPWFWLLTAFLTLQFGLFWLRPLWLLKIDDSLRSFPIKKSLFGIDFSLQSLIFLKYQDRVLDAWVEVHADVFHNEFCTIENVEARRIFIPSPVTLDGRTIAAVTNQDLDGLFARPILIWGEGGVGKTSLACQIAGWAMADKQSERICKHRMLPILLEEDLEGDPQSCQESLLESILGHLKLLTRADHPISKELLDNLLRRRRVMVIVDHLSEMNEVTRKAINPDNPVFPVNALVVTSRQRDILGKVNMLTIKPLRIMGNRLSSFMEAYLVKQGKRELFTDTEFFDACSHLSRMVGQREVTAMLATLYAKQLIHAKVEAAQDITSIVSDNIPDLMLNYLNQLNKELGERRADHDPLEDRAVHKDAMIIAWQCVKEQFRPSVIDRGVAIQALAELRGDQAESHLRYLEERLLLIQTIGASKDQIRFTLDPLAEYLAALRLLELYDGSEEKWLSFLAEAQSKPGGPASIAGFLSALQDCWLTKGKPAWRMPAVVAASIPDPHTLPRGPRSTAPA
ncbi:MAG: HEAT repeat domain-containing protein [Cyanobacteriota bacterium]